MPVATSVAGTDLEASLHHVCGAWDEYIGGVGLDDGTCGRPWLAVLEGPERKMTRSGQA